MDELSRPRAMFYDDEPDSIKEQLKLAQAAGFDVGDVQTANKLRVHFAAARMAHDNSSVKMPPLYAVLVIDCLIAEISKNLGFFELPLVSVPEPVFGGLCVVEHVIATHPVYKAAPIVLLSENPFDERMSKKIDELRQLGKTIFAVKKEPPGEEVVFTQTIKECYKSIMDAQRIMGYNSSMEGKKNRAKVAVSIAKAYDLGDGELASAIGLVDDGAETVRHIRDGAVGLISTDVAGRVSKLIQIGASLEMIVKRTDVPDYFKNHDFGKQLRALIVSGDLDQAINNLYEVTGGVWE